MVQVDPTQLQQVDPTQLQQVDPTQLQQVDPTQLQQYYPTQLHQDGGINGERTGLVELGRDYLSQDGIS